MNLLEFQAKELFSRFGIATPTGRLADNAADAERIATRLGFDRFVIKAQIGAGDRASSGGVRFAASPQGVRATADLMLNETLVTSQTGTAGERPRWVLIEEAIDPRQSNYAAVALDRQRGEVALLTSAAGGTDLELRAARDATLIDRTPLQLTSAGAEGDFEGAARRLGLDGTAATAAATLFRALARIAVEVDATLVEINPLALTHDDQFVALDAKLVIDDNALFRQPALAALRAATQIEQGDPEALAADSHQLNYQRMDGDIGVVVNGAGLALATLDLLTERGGKPANFMDIRTTASSLDVAYGFELIVSNPRVKVVLINVHGGGMQRCDTIAEGVGVALRRAGRHLPVVVRFAGNNADFALTRLKSYGVAFEEGTDMDDAVARAVAISRSRG